MKKNIQLLILLMTLLFLSIDFKFLGEALSLGTVEDYQFKKISFEGLNCKEFDVIHFREDEYSNFIYNSLRKDETKSTGKCSVNIHFMTKSFYLGHKEKYNSYPAIFSYNKVGEKLLPTSFQNPSSLFAGLTRIPFVQKILAKFVRLFKSNANYEELMKDRVVYKLYERMPQGLDFDKRSASLFYFEGQIISSEFLKRVSEVSDEFKIRIRTALSSILLGSNNFYTLYSGSNLDKITFDKKIELCNKSINLYSNQLAKLEDFSFNKIQSQLSTFIDCNSKKEKSILFNPNKNDLLAFNKPISSNEVFLFTMNHFYEGKKEVQKKSDLTKYDYIVTSEKAFGDYPVFRLIDNLKKRTLAYFTYDSEHIKKINQDVQLREVYQVDVCKNKLKVVTNTIAGMKYFNYSNMKQGILDRVDCGQLSNHQVLFWPNYDYLLGLARQKSHKFTEDMINYAFKPEKVEISSRDNDQAVKKELLKNVDVLIEPLLVLNKLPVFRVSQRINNQFEVIGYYNNDLTPFTAINLKSHQDVLYTFGSVHKYSLYHFDIVGKAHSNVGGIGAFLKMSLPKQTKLKVTFENKPKFKYRFVLYEFPETGLCNESMMNFYMSKYTHEENFEIVTFLDKAKTKKNFVFKNDKWVGMDTIRNFFTTKNDCGVGKLEIYFPLRQQQYNVKLKALELLI